MSRETLDWLSSNTLIGFTASRGTAWHYREGDDNHYEGPVPVEAARKLFAWEPLVIPHTYPFNNEVRTSDRVNVLHPTTGDLLGVFKDGYVAHGYAEWLLSKVELLLDDELAIGSAGLLKRGAVAWVQVELPETITQASTGVGYRPHLLAATSLDGSIATTYKRSVTIVVCDNTLSAAMGESTPNLVKVKHTRNSLPRLDVLTSRQALGIVYQMADEVGQAIEQLCSRSVSDTQWAAFLDAHQGSRPEDKGKSQTLYDNKRDKLQLMWHTDPRVAPWKGTAWGVVQAVNTYAHHEGIVRGMTRPMRNMDNAVRGEWDKVDAETLAQLDRVLARS